MKLKIKRVTPSDIGPLNVLANQLQEELGSEYPVIDGKEIEKLMFLVLQHMNDAQCIYLIAYDGKIPVGFFIGNLAVHAYGRPELIGIAQDLYVVPDKRGGEVGMRLIGAAVQRALDAGVQGFEAVGTFGKTDQRWIKLGFKPYVTYMYMDKDECAKLFVKPPKEDKQ